MSYSFVKLAAVKAADMLQDRLQCQLNALLTTITLFISEGPDMTRNQFGNIPVSMTNVFLNIQRKMQIVIGAVLLDWNTSMLQPPLLDLSFILP